MKVITLRIDGQEFFLPEDIDVPSLQQQIIGAVVGPPSFVTFQPLGHGEISVLVTAHVPVRFETAEVSEEQQHRWDEFPPAIDVFPPIE